MEKNQICCGKYQKYKLILILALKLSTITNKHKQITRTMHTTDKATH